MAWTVRSWRGTNDEHGDERRQRTVSNGREKVDWQGTREGRREENEDPIKRRVLLRWLSRPGQHLRATAALVRSIVRQRLKDKSNRASDRDAKKARTREEIDSSLLARG